MARQAYGTLVRKAVEALTALDDHLSVTVSEWTGWGDGIIPANAEFQSVKTDQALKALLELPGADQMRKDYYAKIQKSL